MSHGDRYTPAFEEKLREWLELDENQNRRGARVEANERARKARRQFESALRHAEAHWDPEVRRQACKLARGTPHRSFPETEALLRKLHGQAIKAERRQADERRQASERDIELDDRYALRELRSMKSLRQVGRALGNCVATAGYARRYLRAPDTKMWVLVDRERQRPLCLLEVTVKDREITECGGPGGSTPKLKRSLALAILAALDVSGDDEEAFARIGAYGALDGERSREEAVEAGGRRYRIRLLRGGAEIVIASQNRPGERWRWSRFTRREDEVVAGFYSELSTEELLALVLDHPPFAAALRQPAG